MEKISHRLIYWYYLGCYNFYSQFLISRGNVTTYEWIHGEPPLVVEEPKIDLGEELEDQEVTDKNDEIDFDFDMSADIDLSQVQLEAPIEIDWGSLNEAADGSDDTVIDWDSVECVVQVSKSEFVFLNCRIEKLQPTLANAFFQLEIDGVEGGVARDADALTILDNRKTRNLILNDLHELVKFFHKVMFLLST